MRKSISLVLTLGMLCSSLSPVYSKVNAKLEAEIAREYQVFKGHSILGLKQQPCRAIQFVYELQEKLQKTHDKHIAEKIAAIISEGAGVGGIDTSRQATEDERKIIFTGLANLYEYSNKNITGILLPKELSSHQKIICDVMELIDIHDKLKHSSIKNYDFINDVTSFNNFNRIIEAKSLLQNTIFNNYEISLEENVIITKYIYARPSLNINRDNLQRLVKALCKNVDDNPSKDSPLEILLEMGLADNDLFQEIDNFLSPSPGNRPLLASTNEFIDLERSLEKYKLEEKKLILRELENRIYSFSTRKHEIRQSDFDSALHKVRELQWVQDKVDTLTSENDRFTIGLSSLENALEIIYHSNNSKYLDNTESLLEKFITHPSLSRTSLYSIYGLLTYLYIDHPLDSKYVLESTLAVLDGVTVDNIYISKDFFKFLVGHRNQIDSTFNHFSNFTQNLANSIGLYDFIKIFEFIAKMKPSHRDQIMPQIVRLISPTDNVSDRYQKLIRVENHLNRGAFINFLINNQVTLGQEIEELSGVPNPADWANALRGIRDRARNFVPHIQGMANQTVHDSEYEASIKDSVGKLGNRYKSLAFQDLSKIKENFNRKIDDLLTKNLLTAVEAKIAHHFFTAGFDRIKTGGSEEKIKQYLNLAWQALDDKQISRQLGSATNFTDKDTDDRFAGWLKSGPIDAQLAYKLDSLGGQFKDKEDLLKAIEKDSSLMTSGQSCVGGSYNRLIDALNLIHPDVELKTGAGNLKNIDLMNRLNFLKKQSIALLREIYEEDSDKFNNLEELKKNVKEALAKDFEEELKKNHPTMNTPQVRTQEIDNFFNNDYADAMRQVTTLAPVYEYIDAPLQSAESLTKDVKQKLGDIKNLSFRTLEGSIKTHVKTLVTAKLQSLKTSPSDKEKTSGLTYALEQTGIIGLSIRKEMIKHRIEGMELNIKQIAKEFKEIESKIVEQIKSDIERYNKSNPQKKKTVDLTFLNTFSYFIQKTIKDTEGFDVEIGEIQQVWRNFMNKGTFKPLK